MKKQISIDALNAQLFETIEMLKNNSDPQASDNEKIDIDTARSISDLGRVIVEGYKVKAQVLNLLSKTENPTILRKTGLDNGILELSENATT